MRQFFITCLIFIFLPTLIFGQSIFENPITGTNPNLSDPYTTGQYVNSNITVTGIGRGSGIFGVNANNRYDAKSWKSDDLDSNTYFEFTIIPNADRKIDFISFVYTGQTSANGPTLFAFRSSIDGFTSDIGSVSAPGSIVSLLAADFQNIKNPITFRLYGWAATAGTGTFSINDFQFNGVVSCVTPQTVTLTAPSFSCSSTSFVLNWPASQNTSNYFIDVATDSGFVNYLTDYQDKLLGNVLSETVTGLKAGGTYYVRLKSGNSCATSIYSNVVKAAPPETIYTGIWSNGAPDATKNVRFSSNFNVSSSFDACSCQIDDGVTVYVDSGGVLKLQNGLDIQGNSSLILENNASLIQVNDDAINTGVITCKRITSPMKNFDFTYWSSPVKGQKLNVLSPNTLSDKFFSFDNGNWIYENGGNTMNPPGKGFIIRVPKPDTHYPNGEYWTGSTYAQPVKFIGVPNNGIIQIPAQGAGKDNLIGNPYPSAIDADEFINVNAAVIDGALNFWTHNTAITQSGSSYVYNSDDYASYTLTGGTGTGELAKSGGAVPNGKIASGVSFFVTSKADGNFVFNNGMRISDLDSNSQFFRMSNTKKIETIEKNRIWLNLSNSEGAFKQLLVGYVTGASNEMDNLYDGVSLDGNTYVDFYSINKDNKLTIQGRALPFDKGDKVPLGYKTTIEGAFQISIDKVDGVLVDQTVFVEDNLTKAVHNLKDGPYSFTTAKGTFDDRFMLVYVDKTAVVRPSVIEVVPTANSCDSTFENMAFDKKGEPLIVSVRNCQIKINSFEKTMAIVMVYDSSGRLLYENKKVNSNQFAIEEMGSSDQFLIVMVQLTNGNRITKEIIFKN